MLAKKFNKFVHASKSKPTKKLQWASFWVEKAGWPASPQDPVARTKIALLRYKHNRDLEPALYSRLAWLIGLAHLYKEALWGENEFGLRIHNMTMPKVNKSVFQNLWRASLLFPSKKADER